MFEDNKAQVIIVNRSPVDDSIQIVVPPFRPISLYEIDDSYEEVREEIFAQVDDKIIANKIIEFMDAFKDSIDTKDAFPIVEYFIDHYESDMEPDHIKQIFDSVDEFIESIHDQNRLMH